MIGDIPIWSFIITGILLLIVWMKIWAYEDQKKKKREEEKKEYTKRFLAEKGYSSMQGYLDKEGERLIEEARKEREIEKGLNELAQAGKLRINGQLVEQISNGIAVIKREEQDNEQQ